MPSDRVNEYLKSVCAEVRWRQAHDAVKSELAAHIEDQAEAFMRKGMERDAAEEKAVESMGDPAETGLRLDASYRPKTQRGPVMMLITLLVISAVCRLLEYGSGGAPGKFIAAACIGGGLFIWLYNANMYRLAEWSRAAYLAAVLLCLAAFPLCRARGRGVDATLQTAAIAMPALFAGWLYGCRDMGLKGLLIGGAALGVPVMGMIAAPYVGAAVNVAAACLMLIALASVWGVFGKNRWLPIAVSWGGTLGGGYLLLRTHDYWRSRAMAALHPEAYPAEGYNIMAVRDMLHTSRPIGCGSDTEITRFSIFYKRNGDMDRDAYVDYLLTSIAHRYGWVIALIIAAVLIGLIAMLFFRTLKLTSLFGKMMGCGICASLLMQTAQYILGNCGAAAVSWLPLPFISYGNTSLVINMAMMGLLGSLMRSDGLYADREAKPLNKLRLRLEWEK